MNWDSGLGFERWHQGKKLGLTQEALIGLASSDTLLPGKQWGQWSKSMLDNGFDFYSRLAARSENGLRRPRAVQRHARSRRASAAPTSPPRASRPTPPARSTPGSARRRPPPRRRCTRYDPDIGRLAVTTPTYNTAVVAVNQNAFPYGGLDLARLFDGQQEVAANIGGRAPASFGLMVRDVAGRRVTASQIGRSRVVAGSRPLRLIKAPSGAGAISSAAIGRAYAGPVQRPARDRHLLHVDAGDARDAPVHDAIGSRPTGPSRGAPGTLATPPTSCSRAGRARAPHPPRSSRCCATARRSRSAPG